MYAADDTSCHRAREGARKICAEKERKISTFAVYSAKNLKLARYSCSYYDQGQHINDALRPRPLAQKEEFALTKEMNAEMTCQPPPRGKRIGMLTPSSNTVLEPLTNALLAPIANQATAHFGRFRVTQIALDGASDRQFAPEPVLDAASLLADAHPHVIAWNGTSASWLGFVSDDRLCEAITQRTGIPASSTIVALNRLLHLLGIPIPDSVAVTLWGCLNAICVDPAPLSRYGQLFSIRERVDA